MTNLFSALSYTHTIPTHLFCALIKEDKRGVLCMGKAALLNEGTEDLGVEEEFEERPLSGGAGFEEQALVEQVRDVPGPLRRGR